MIRNDLLLARGATFSLLGALALSPGIAAIAATAGCGSEDGSGTTATYRSGSHTRGDWGSTVAVGRGAGALLAVG